MAHRHWGTGIPPQTRRYEKIPREAFRYDSPYGPAFNSRIDPAQLQFEMARQALNYNHRKEQFQYANREMSQRKVQVAGINESTHSAPRRRNSKASVKVQRYWEPEHRE
ncbi:hypothetical protein H0H87_010512 [Tephrocybe sp. NHM501043]|nr:hypothetical protein H0H87_010512 [Tephrocybe sp. NHM501043]